MKLNESITRLILISIALILAFSCGRALRDHAANDFYSQALDEIVSRSQIHGCARISQQQEDELQSVYDQYLKGEIDSLEFIEFEADAVEAVKDTATCTFDLSDNFNVYSRVGHGLEPQQIERIVNALRAQHVDEFIGVSIEQIIDSISMPSTKSAADFAVDYIKLIPFERTDESFARSMKGSGIFSFSNARLSKDGEEAVFYYEYVCRGKCGVGEIVIMQRTGTQWKIVNTIEMWIS